MEKKEYYLLVIEEECEESYHSLYATYEDALRDFYMQVGRIMCDVIETKSTYIRDVVDGSEEYIDYLYKTCSFINFSVSSLVAHI